jgi:hypothetical protein
MMQYMIQNIRFTDQPIFVNSSVLSTYRVETTQGHHFPWSWQATLKSCSNDRCYSPATYAEAKPKDEEAMSTQYHDVVEENEN